MAANQVAEMSLEELAEFVDKRIEQAFTRKRKQCPMAEVNASIRKHRIIPPPGAKSAVVMIREDRDT